MVIDAPYLYLNADLYKKKTEREYDTILNEGNANKYIKWLTTNNITS